MALGEVGCGQPLTQMQVTELRLIRAVLHTTRPRSADVRAGIRSLRVMLAQLTDDSHTSSA